MRGFAKVVSGFQPLHILRLEVAGPFLEQGRRRLQGRLRVHRAQYPIYWDAPQNRNRRSRNQAGFLLRISAPYLAAPNSRNAMTVGLSRLASTRGVAPLISCRAR